MKQGCAPEPIKFKGNATDVLSGICKALGHPARVQILKLLIEKQSCISGDLANEIDLAPSTVSEHMRVMKEAGLIAGTIDGPRRCYCINGETLKLLKSLVKGL